MRSSGCADGKPPRAATQHARVADAARGDEIVGILESGSVLSVISLYSCGAANAQGVGRRPIILLRFR